MPSQAGALSVRTFAETYILVRYPCQVLYYTHMAPLYWNRMWYEANENWRNAYINWNYRGFHPVLALECAYSFPHESRIYGKTYVSLSYGEYNVLKAPSITFHSLGTRAYKL